CGGFGSDSSGCGEIHAGAPASGFRGSSRSATSCSRTATVAEDFPHGKGSWMSDISKSRGDGKRKAPRWLRLSLSFSFLLLALGYEFRKQRRRRRRRRSRTEANGQVNPKHPLLRIYLPRGAHPQPWPKSTAFNAVDFAITDGWAPRPRSFPRAHAAINAAR